MKAPMDRNKAPTPSRLWPEKIAAKDPVTHFILKRSTMFSLKTRLFKKPFSDSWNYFFILCEKVRGRNWPRV